MLWVSKCISASAQQQGPTKTDRKIFAEIIEGDLESGQFQHDNKGKPGWSGEIEIPFLSSQRVHRVRY